MNMVGATSSSASSAGVLFAGARPASGRRHRCRSTQDGDSNAVAAPRHAAHARHRHVARPANSRIEAARFVDAGTATIAVNPRRAYVNQGCVELLPLLRRAAGCGCAYHAVRCWRRQCSTQWRGRQTRQTERFIEIASTQHRRHVATGQPDLASRNRRRGRAERWERMQAGDVPAADDQDLHAGIVAEHQGGTDELPSHRPADGPLSRPMNHTDAALRRGSTHAPTCKADGVPAAPARAISSQGRVDRGKRSSSTP